MSKKIRLHQFLSKTGLFKLKKDILIALGNKEIKVNDKVINSPHYHISKFDRVYYKNKEIKIEKGKTYILLNKPEGYLSSKLTENDIRLGKKSVFSLINLDENIKKTLFCVGRLDEDTSGLLIITNDGDLSHEITDPESEIKKVYEAELENDFSEDDKERVENGVMIELEENGKFTSYKTKKCKVDIKNRKKVWITVSEGRKREVRRIFEALENKVLKLERICIGNLDLRKLKIPLGKYITVKKENLSF
jgi:pseudouridine synthase